MALRCPAIRRMEPAQRQYQRLAGRPQEPPSRQATPRRRHRIAAPEIAPEDPLPRSNLPLSVFATCRLFDQAGTVGAHSVPVGFALDAYRSLHFTPTAGCQQSAARMRAGPQRKLDGTALFRHRPSRRADQPMQKRQYALGGRRPGVVAPITIRKPQQFHEACLQKRTDAPGRGHTNTPTRQAPRDQRSPSA